MSNEVKVGDKFRRKLSDRWFFEVVFDGFNYAPGPHPGQDPGVILENQDGERFGIRVSELLSPSGHYERIHQLGDVQVGDYPVEYVSIVGIPGERDYRVLAIDDDKAWLKTGSTRISLPVSRLRKVQ